PRTTIAAVEPERAYQVQVPLRLVRRNALRGDGVRNHLAGECVRGIRRADGDVGEVAGHGRRDRGLREAGEDDGGVIALLAEPLDQGALGLRLHGTRDELLPRRAMLD